MSKAVFCIVRSEALAKDIVEKLKVMGFSGNDISVLLPDRSGTRDFAYEQHTKAPEGATAGGLVGGTAGGVVGWPDWVRSPFPASDLSWRPVRSWPRSQALRSAARPEG